MKRRGPRSGLLVGFSLAGAFLGCAAEDLSVGPDVPPRTDDNCVSDTDCEDGTCDHALGACVAESGELDALLFEITPASSDARFGGLKVFHTASGLSVPTDAGLSLNVPEPVLVQGEVLVHQTQQACTGNAARTLPVELEFRPRERVLGIETPVYVARTVPVDFEYRFSDLELPPGVFDIYVHALDPASLPPDPDATGEPPCDIVPQLFRGVVVEARGSISLALQQTEPVDLLVRIPFEERMEGWVIDVIHPTSGERISTRSTLRGVDAQSTEEGLIFEASLQYSLVSGQDFVRSDQQLVRLTPPPGAVEPTTLYHRSGLEVFRPGEAVLGTVGPFRPVSFRAWVWENGEPDLAIGATVHFAALELKGVSGGVFTDFRRSVEVDDSGEVSVTLLPGTYRVRTVPKSVLRGVSALESLVTVREPAPGETEAVQAGHVFALPASAHIRSQVRLPGGAAAIGVAAEALPASPQSVCLADEEVSEGGCGVLLPDVLNVALAQDVFRPRVVTALVGEKGALDLAGADCGACEPEGGSLFDLIVRPDASTGQAWRVFRGVRVAEDVALAPIQLHLAVVQRGVLTFGASEALPGALIRAYALLDADGRYVSNPQGLPWCVESAEEPSASACVSEALQVAETRVDSDGSFVLPLPTRLR